MMMSIEEDHHDNFDPLPPDHQFHPVGIDDIEEVLEGNLFNDDDDDDGGIVVHRNHVVQGEDGDHRMMFSSTTNDGTTSHTNNSSSCSSNGPSLHGEDDGNCNGGFPNRNPYNTDSDDTDNDSYGSKCFFMGCSGGLLFGRGGTTTTATSHAHREREQFIPGLPKHDVTVEEANYHRATSLKHGFTDFEREFVFHDIRGTGRTIPETTGMVKDALYEMEFELNQISRNTSYEVALKQNPTYVKDCKFRIKFLRAEYFQPRKAANRCVRYFEEKMMLFGPERYVLLACVHE